METGGHGGFHISFIPPGAPSSFAPWSLGTPLPERPGTIVCFSSGFRPAAAVLTLTTRWWAVPTVVTVAGNGSVFLGLLLPLTQLTRFIISLHPRVSHSEARGSCEILSLIHSATVKTKLFVGISQSSLYTSFTSHYGHKYFCICYCFYRLTRPRQRE
ncbi:hypothetical protein HJG60_007980 [Phyllostomus discolor]|uniref:Uncharacterized protein n=1 Tax=Phyllostomus discolor TaxID=89673 RepID=A0A834BHZ1_9CHIR|nr:hypothetical protein HJG60_007980 [Phyllostomus discolor]